MRIEEKANGKIREDAQVEEYEMDRADAEERFGGA
jgi:alanyl-tRNA synthetase